jgi:hypothetical protein
VTAESVTTESLRAIGDKARSLGLGDLARDVYSAESLLAAGNPAEAAACLVMGWLDGLGYVGLRKRIEAARAALEVRP